MSSLGFPYRPKQWSNPSTPNPTTVLITFPGTGQAAQYNGAVGSTVILPPTQTLYVFDAVMQIDHQQELRKTEHPVQTGASISDHAYAMPARLILDVGMSDVMDSFYRPSTWSGSPSKSVSAYQTMLALQFSRILLKVTTKLRTYSNMVIESLNPSETSKTYSGLRMRVEFSEVFLANITVADSLRSQTSANTITGRVYVVPPPPEIIQQNVTPPDFSPIWNSTGAGDASSVPLSQSVGGL